MGTRNLTAVYANGEYRVAQYGQWDGYPAGQGVTALEILSSVNLKELKAKVLKCSWLSREQVDSYWAEFDPDSEGFVTLEQSRAFKAKYPHLSRDTSAEILKLIMDSPDGLELMDDLFFAKNSLFCEWAYVIDFDKGTFEVYKGFNKTPTDKKERFYFDGYKDDEYYPVKLVHSFDLNALPSKEAFLAICEPQNEEEEGA